MQRYLILSVLICTSFFSYAFKLNDHLVQGVVKDDKGVTLIHSTVMLLKSNDSSLVKGDITNDRGEFAFEQIESGSYLISTSNVGFKKYYSGSFTLDESNKSFKQDIQLQPSDKSVKEVKVIGKKPLIEIKADKTVFNVEQSINASGSNALDLLRKSPGVRVDKDDNIEMRGKNNVLIYVDGKPTYLSDKDLASMLKNMQSSDIEAIELITNPSAKYDASGNAGIINLKLKKNKKFGTNGNAGIGLAQGKYFKENASLHLNNRNRKVNLFGNYVFSNGRNYNLQHLNRTQNMMRYDLKSDNSHSDLTNSVRAGVDYYMNSKSVFGVMVNMTNATGKFSSDSRTQIGPANDAYNQVLIASNSIPMTRLNAGLNANYKFEDTAGHSFNVDLDYGMFKSTGKSYQPNTYYNKEENSVISQTIFRNNTPTDIKIYSVKADYEQNLFKGKIGLGVKSAIVKTDNDFKFYDVINQVDTLNLFRSNHFVYSENVNAAYVNYSKNIGSDLSLQLGLRAEQTNSEGKLSSAIPQQDDTVKRQYLDFFPSAGITYNLNKNHSIGLTYSRRIDRPNYQDLNPFENKLDELTYEKGNAFLRPQYTNSVEFNHTYMQFLTTSLSYSHTKDMFMQTTDTTEISRTYVTQKNFATQDMAGVNVGFPLPVRKWWMVYANINANYVILQADFEGRRLKNKYFTYVFYADNTFTLPKNFSLNISGWYSGPSYWGGTFKLNPMGSLDIGIQKTFLQKKLTAKLSLTDVLRTQGWYAVSNFAGLYIDANGYNESRQIRLNLSYRFGSNEIAKQRERKSGATNESDRIKK